MNKLIGILLCAALPLSAHALNFEYPYLYKDPRAMGMGGAGVAVGGSAAAVFSNPAGIARIDPQAGFEVDLLPLHITYNENVRGFFDDLSAATDSNNYPTQAEQDQAVNDVLRKYLGKNLHGSAQTFPSIARKGSQIGFTVGYLAAGKFDGRAHQGFGSEGVLEADANATSGPVLGLSYDAMDGALALGLGLKKFKRVTLRHNFTARELVEQSSTMEDYIKNNLKKEGSGGAFDLGAIYRPFKEDYWQMALGMSVLNVGGLNFGDAGKIPQTVNLGVAVSPDLGFINKWTFALDYVDLFNGFEQDKDQRKRLRLGAELRLWENSFTGMALRAGLYQGKPTMGADFRLAVLRVAYTSYTEQIGAFSGQDSDRRHMLSFVLGW